MSTWFCLVFVTLNHFIIFKLSYQTLLKIATKKLNVQRFEEYTFEGELNRARDECSYMALVNDTVVRNKTVQMIKEKISNRRLKEFYEQKEIEKQRAKEYYENVKKQAKKRVLQTNRPRWNHNFIPPRAFPPLPPPLPPMPPGPPMPPQPFVRRQMYKRTADLNGRRRKTSNGFSEVSFTDYNNCSSRCIFARMEMVNPFGFPDESLITKLIDDKITNKKIRLLKTKKVSTCFKKMEEVAFDDSCIFSARLFECLDLGETYAWSTYR